MLSDREQILQLLYTYAERIDAGDFVGVAELFREARITTSDPSSTFSGYDAVLAMYNNSTRRYDDGTPHTKHIVSNTIVDITPDQNHASARSYFTVYQSLPDFPLQAIIAGRYHDRFCKRADGWQFLERNMLPELFGDLSRHLLFDPAEIQ